ncbi:MAG: DNRLRE domain-containing protein [Lysobacterales bacterium]|nr:MAG: DNRLRE domain-containing protein [Xanthomonadales bacterium]
MILVYNGIPSSAGLHFWYASNNNRDHQILVNDQDIGRLPIANPPVNYRSKCGDLALSTEHYMPFDPSILQTGLNKVTILADRPYETDGWSMQNPQIDVTGSVRGSTIKIVQVESSWDGTTQRAMIQEPIGYDPVMSGTLPLVVALHWWSASDYDAMTWMAQAASDYGWLLVCPDVRHESLHTPTLAAQSDIMDAMNMMFSEYNIDQDRVYLAGISMGGMMAATFAAKNPHLFAAVAELKGATDVTAWYYEAPSRQIHFLHDTNNNTPYQDPFTYQRMSSANMPMNLRNLPTVIVHGLQDAVVLYHHASDLKAGMDAWDPVDVELYPYEGGHEADHPDWGAHGILAFFDKHVRNERPLRVVVRTDEPKPYYWLDIAYAHTYPVEDHWTFVDATLNPGTQTITIDVRDERSVPIPVNITLDMLKMGLPTGVSYTVEDTNVNSGVFAQYPLQAGATSLVLNVSAAYHRFTIYPFSAPNVQTVLLRQGEQGYTGVADTYVDSFLNTDNFAAQSDLRVTDGGARKALVRFDLSSLPSNAVVKAAQFGIYLGPKWDGSYHTDMAIYRVLNAWQVNQATWQYRMSGVPWAQSGVQAAGEDYAEVVYAAQELRNAPQWYYYNVTDLVRTWVADPASNQGMLLKGRDGQGTFVLSSSESSSNRPQLSVQYAFATVTPTPSLTPTPTLTAVPSPTATSQLRGLYLPVVMKNS